MLLNSIILSAGPAGPPGGPPGLPGGPQGPPGGPEGPIKIKAEVKTEPEYRSPAASPSPRPPSPRDEPPRNHPKIKHTENKVSPLKVQGSLFSLTSQNLLIKILPPAK